MDNTKAIQSEDDYRVWSKCFLSVATVRGYREILTGKKIKIPKHTKLLTDTNKKEMRLRKANNRAYCDLVISCQGDIGLDLVDEVVTANLPEGDANLAWKKLKERFDPQDAADKVRLKDEFTNSKLSDWKENLEDWITQLEIKMTKLKRMGQIISDKDLTSLRNMSVKWNS